MKTPGADSSGRLAGTMLEVALAEVTEPERLRRGRRYARQGAVRDLDVAPGLVTAKVQGSRAEPYEVQIRIAISRQVATRLADLVPRSGAMRFGCSCPDWEEPCKHGVAVMTELAERVAYDPALLARWRGAGANAAVEEDDPVAASPPAFDRAELDAFLGGAGPIDVPLPTLTPLPHVQMTWDEPWSVMLHDALRVVTRAR